MNVETATEPKSGSSNVFSYGLLIAGMLCTAGIIAFTVSFLPNPSSPSDQASAGAIKKITAEEWQALSPQGKLRYKEERRKLRAKAKAEWKTKALKAYEAEKAARIAEAEERNQQLEAEYERANKVIEIDLTKSQLKGNIADGTVVSAHRVLLPNNQKVLFKYYKEKEKPAGIVKPVIDKTTKNLLDSLKKMKVVERKEVYNPDLDFEQDFSE